MKQISLKQQYTLGEVLFFIALILYASRFLLSRSILYSSIPHIVITGIRSTICILLLIKILTAEEYTFRTAILFVIIEIVILIVAISIDYTDLVITVTLIISAYNIKFDQILKYLAIIMLFWTLLFLVLTGLGVLVDRTYPHHLLTWSLTAHSFGYNDYSSWGRISTVLIAIYLFLRRRCRYLELFLLTAFSVALYLIHTNALSLIMSLAVIAFYLICVKWHWITLKAKFWKGLAIVVPWFFCIFNLILVALYANNPIQIDAISTFLSRFKYSVMAFQQFDVRLFGNHVEMTGLASVRYGTGQTYFYIDSGYIYMIIVYGIILTIGVLIVYSLLGRYVYSLQDPYLYFWVVIILGANCVNNFLLTPVFNPIIFMAPIALFGLYKTRRKITVVV